MCGSRRPARDVPLRPHPARMAGLGSVAPVLAGRAPAAARSTQAAGPAVAAAPGVVPAAVRLEARVPVEVRSVGRAPAVVRSARAVGPAAAAVRDAENDFVRDWQAIFVFPLVKPRDTVL